MARLYRLKDKSKPDSLDRLVRANSRNQAITYAASKMFHAEAADADDVEELMGANVKPEDANEVKTAE